MADEQQPIGADDVARKQFATAFRGFDQYEVRAFLARLAAELAAGHERERSLREQLVEAESRPAPPAPVGEAELEAALGVETTRVLHAAREAAAEIRAKAEESVARMLREANDDAGRMRSEAEAILARRTEEAEAASAAILAAAEETAAILRADAQAGADATVEEAKEQGREMLAEAQAVRERVLKDLARRRKAATAQLEQLSAGRERLLSAYDVVRTTLEDATRRLTEVEAPTAAPEEEPVEEPVAVAAPEPAPVVEPEAEAEPEPEPEPEPPSRPVSIVPPLPQEAEPDDRRSSSLRLLRRKAEAEADVPLLDDDVEGVRLLRTDAAPAPRPVVVPDPEVADVEAERPVDDLFARLRADRQAAVAKAEQVLAEPEPAPEPDAEPEVAPEPVAADDSAFEARDAAVEAAERALTRALKRTLADEQNEVLDNLRRLRGAPTLAALLPEPGEHAGRFASMAVEQLGVGAAAGAASFDGAAPGIDELAAVLAADVTDDVRSRLERALDATSGDEEALVEAISATYREWKTARTEPLARHHVAAAYALGVFSAAPGEELVWLVDEAEGGCPDCDDNALAGPTRRGQAFPTGQLHPPAHAGCRCLVLPAT
jgi:DivIVA domain-containing protein